MRLEIKIQEIHDVVVIGLIGNLDSTTAPEAEAEINRWIEKNSKRIILNLYETNYVSSAGLRIFLGSFKKMAAVGGSLKICCARDVVKETLDISGFSKMLDIKLTQDEAMDEI